MNFWYMDRLLCMEVPRYRAKPKCMRAPKKYPAKWKQSGSVENGFEQQERIATQQYYKQNPAKSLQFDRESVVWIDFIKFTYSLAICLALFLQYSLLTHQNVAW